MGSILSEDDVIAGLTQRSQTLTINKASIANAVAGAFQSLWRATGYPTQGAIPTTAAVCHVGTTGAQLFNAVGATQELHIARAFLVSSNAGTDVQLYDRLAACGGMSGTVTTAQPANVDVTGSSNNLANRIGPANYREVLWFLEWYGDTGGTGVNATCAVTYDDASTGNIVVPVGATTRASRLLPIFPAVAGRNIRSIQSVTLSATTGTAGNFGVTAMRRLTSVALGNANAGELLDWAQLGLPRIHAEACVQYVVISTTTSTGTVIGGLQAIASVA
jgi:hypothetical protein